MVKKLLQQRKRTGQIGARHAYSGRKPLIVQAHEDKMRLLLGRKPDMTLKELPDAALTVIGQTLNFYDGPAFQGLDFKQIGEHGALVRTENLVLTANIVQQAYGGQSPPYLIHNGA